MLRQSRALIRGAYRSLLRLCDRTCGGIDHAEIVQPSRTVSKRRCVVTDTRLLVAAVPTSLSVRWALRRHRDLHKLLAVVDATATRRAPRRWWGEPVRVAVAVHWCFRLADRSCVGRSLTTYALLRRQGMEPSFVSGIALASSRLTGLDGHAWVELEGTPLDPSDRDVATHFREILRHPQRG